MPLYEYACTKCEHQFETLVRNGETPECPACHATALERRLSFLDQDKVGARPSPVIRTGMRFALAPPMILVNLHGHYSGPG